MSLIDFVQTSNNDALNITFEDKTASKGELLSCLQGDANVLVVNVYMKNGLPSTSDLDLFTWLEIVSKAENTKAIKLNFENESALSQSLFYLKEFRWQQPIWISFKPVEQSKNILDTFSGSGEDEDSNMINIINDIYPEVTLVPNYWTNLNDNILTWDDVDEIYEMIKNTSQYIVISINIQNIQINWNKVLWLLQQSERFSLFIETDDSIADDITDDLLFVRDNYKLSHVYYSDEETMNQPIKDAISFDRQKSFYSGGDVLDFFRLTDSMMVTWAHRVNSRLELEEALTDDRIHMIEADIRVDDGVAVMAHDPIALGGYDVTLEEWLQLATNCEIEGCRKVGIKLDYKTTAAVDAGMKVVAQFQDQLNIPVWVNADILSGPNSNPFMVPVDASLFFQYVHDNFDDVTLSLGWKTGYKRVGVNEIYTMEMVTEMFELCRHLRQPVTFAARASLTKSSINSFQWLLSKSNRFSLTVWYSTSEEVSVDDLVEIYQSFASNKIFFDLPEDLMQDLIDAMNFKLLM